MELIRNKINYLKALQRNQIDHDDILAIRLAKILSFVFFFSLPKKHGRLGFTYFKTNKTSLLADMAILGGQRKPTSKLRCLENLSISS